MAGRPPGEHSGSSLVVQRGKGIEQSMIFARCTIPFYLLNLQPDPSIDLAMSLGLSHKHNSICYI